jgi:hypothetical protein
MRFIGLLVVLVAVAVLATRTLHSTSHSPASVPAAQQVVNNARSDLQQAQADQQAQVDQRLQQVETQP